MPALVAASLTGAPAWSEPCPAAPDHSDALAALIQQAQAAQNESDARQIGMRMWELWADAPNEQAQTVLDRGMSMRSGYDYAGALAEFDTLVDYCPEFAEGYNQRAFVNYLRQDYAAALVDLDRAISLSPNHIAARSGRALTLYGLHRTDEARQALAGALALNPWIPERGLAAKGGPLAPRGTDL